MIARIESDPADSGRARLPPRLLATMIGLGFASGLPLFLTNRVLQQWLSESGLSLAAIGAVGVIGLPYVLKFLWAPLFDRAPPPPFRVLGRRRGWLLLAQLGVSLSIAAIACADPRRDAVWLVDAAVALAFFSASQDIAIDAWRIESFAPSRQTAALGLYVWGYRIALVLALSGTIWLAGANPLGWHGAYAAMALLSLSGPALCLSLPEPHAPAHVNERLVDALRRSVAVPFADLLRRPAAVLVLAFVATFNLGTQFADTLAIPLYHRLGYGHDQVAAAIGVPNLIAALAGAALAGVLVRALGLGRALVGCTLVQMASLCVYFVLLGRPPSGGLLIAKTVIEELAESTAQTVFLSYLSLLCAREFAATQYALLSALSALGWRTLAGSSGAIAAAIGMHEFYLFALACCLPSIALMMYLLSRFPAGVPPRISGG